MQVDGAPAAAEPYPPRSICIATVDSGQRLPSGHHHHDPDRAAHERTDQHLPARTPRRTSTSTRHRHASTTGAPRFQHVEDPGTSWERIKAVTGVSAGPGLDRAARPKGLEPLTF